MYHYETMRMTFPVILTIILMYLVGLCPVYISYKLGNRVLLVVSVVFGLLSMWVIPPAISMIIVCTQIPRYVSAPMDKRISTIFWILLFVLFTFLPAAGAFGFNMQGYHLLGFEGVDVFAVLFYLMLIIGVITSLVLKERALFASQMIVLEMCLGTYMILARLLFAVEVVVKSGPYVTMILLVLGTAGMLYMTYKICSGMGAEGRSISKEEVIAGLKSAGESFKDTTGRVREKVSKVVEEGSMGIREKCTNCGAAVSSSQVFCPQCGQKIIREPKMVKRYRCSSCGTYVKNKNNFCGLCGGTVVEVEEEAK